MRLALEVLLLLRAVLPLLALWRGPTLWDRLCGASSLNVRVALVDHAAFLGHQILLDVAISYAILGFLGTVLVARFGERGER